jgi:transposase-like protein
LFPQKIPLYDESATLDFVLSPKNKKKALIRRHIIGNFRILRFWRICFHQNILSMMSQSHWIFVLSPKKEKEKALKSRHIRRGEESAEAKKEFCAGGNGR